MERMPMNFCFYPKHEYACPNVSHCPHLGGAALGTLVDAADEQEDYRRMILGQLDSERVRSAQLSDENEQLKAQVAQLKLELKVERQSRFATSASETSQEPRIADRSDSDDGRPKKRGAPVGHPGWFRPMPAEYDILVEVDAPSRCPHCGGSVHLYPNVEPCDHLQEDVVEGLYKVVLYRHPAARCDSCRNWVKQAGDGELLGSRIGPQLRSKAVYLRNGIGISYRKELHRLEVCALDHEKALTLQGRILRHAGEWLVFIDDPRVPPTNNLAERILRPLVVPRKITFGHRNASNAARMAKLMTVQETAKRHGRKPTDIFYRLYTRPPNQVLRYMYAGGLRPSGP
jgi:hypothetical protein